ncbi:MAG: FAD-dependent oxidoreductase, partial [Armatimonadota bacterium]|nr:FAD-dependent oxidoreductase [Armatimonadota bacterium]
MDLPGTDAHPLRVAIIGAGPTGFYAAEHLLGQPAVVVAVDLFDRLPTPYGLVRYGVAPDHQKIKSVTAVYDRTAAHPRFRFFGNVEFGRHVGLEELSAHYHQILFCTGAQTDRRLNIPGEDLPGSYPATEFVAWYNGHPDYAHYRFDLSVQAAAVVGVGNVAVDVARILLRSAEELARTDIADYALEVLRESRVREVYLLGRRGPAQAAFTNPEIRELADLPGADVTALPEEVALDEISREDLDRTQDRTTLRKVEILQELAARTPRGRPRRLVVRFLVSPVALLSGDGKVARMRLVRNRLETTPAGTLVARPTDRFEELAVGAVFRSVGYRGVPLPGVPFNEDWGVILNERGRVLDPGSREPLPGLYTAGWIKRGPTGVIGTNKPDAAETV